MVDGYKEPLPQMGENKDL